MTPTRLDSVDTALAWLRGRGVRGLCVDSRRVGPGDAFIAWPGHADDGRRHFGAAMAAGAVACVVEADGLEAVELGGAGLGAAAVDGAGARDLASADGSAIGVYAGLKAATGPLAAAFFDAPSEHLSVLAVTGTNGKTSVAWWLAQAFGVLGRRCGLIGTLGVGEPPSPLRAETLNPTGLTTPDPVTLQAGLAGFVAAGFDACAIEATSIGLAEHRLAGTRIEVALWTNLTQDHLDYHGSMVAYRDAKTRLFDWPGLRAAVVNVDDAAGAALVASLGGASPETAGSLPANPALELWTCSVGGAARLNASNLRYDGAGLAFDLREGGSSIAVRSQVLGDFNAANLLAVIGGLRACGVPLADAAAACALLTPVPGRMQRVPSDATGPQVVVDYAHTPDALDKALIALRPFAAERSGALVCVFGCGGDRDPGKRPLMGRIAERLADRVVVTSDNPRHEDAGEIVRQIVGGMESRAAVLMPERRRSDRMDDAPVKVAVEMDRQAAIRLAVLSAGAGDVILVAGKGHEREQRVGDARLPFADFDEAVAALALRPAAGGPAQ